MFSRSMYTIPTHNPEGSEKKFSKYEMRGSYHWREMRSKDPRVLNAYHQAHYDWILKMAGDIRGKKVLDIGCGDGVLSYLLARAGANVTGLDNEEPGLRLAEENLKRENRNGALQYQFVNASAYETPFEPETFDVIVSCEVIEHVQEPERLLAEAHRILKTGGTIILTTPHRLTEFPQDVNHVKEYFPGEIRSLVEKYFRDVEIRLTHHTLWYSLYTYSFPGLGRRAYGKWFINALTIIFGWNPFMIDYTKPGKIDIFSTICVQAKK